MVTDAPESFDVLVVGAGLSGVGAGYRLQTECPGRTYAILEGRAVMGGTWDLFRYPGIRSDSDMFTLGYAFRPWKDPKAIADGDSILRYIQETAAESGVDRHIRYRQKVVAASWSSADARWTVDVEVGDDRRPVRYHAGFLYLCSGYYSYDGGYEPTFPGRDAFAGPVVHPQRWPDDLDYAGKRVVIIGSGATAVTLVPAMAETAEHVTMLQRSPSWITSLPARDALADALRARLPAQLAHSIIRWKNILMTLAFYQLCRRAPGPAKKLLRAGAARVLPDGYELDPDFSPRYEPWDQRLCLVPDGDLFTAIRSGSASIVTDGIDTFTADGIRLASGREIPADVIVTATGLKLVACGGIDLEVDGEVVRPGDTIAYKGFMLSGVPNVAMCVGYTNASWTLRADLTHRNVCRLLNHMEAHGYARAAPQLDEAVVEPRPLLDLSAGYIRRGADVMPQQGSSGPWKVRQNYVLDLLTTIFGRVDRSMSLTRRPTPAVPATPPDVEEVLEGV